jgi:hypothetical protein
VRLGFDHRFAYTATVMVTLIVPAELPFRDLKVPSTHIAYARPGASIGDARNMRKRSAERL